MSFFVDTLRHNPEIALLLTLAVGFWFGAIKFGSFSLGAVTSTLIAGLLIGQLGIVLPPVVQNTFFIMFLFAVGYSVGPQFVPALRKEGLPQVAFTLIVCASAFITAYVAARLLGYDAGLAAGLLAGALTNSGTLGVATTAVHHLTASADQASAMAGLMAVAYAVTYPFGTAGGAWFLASFAPKLLGIDLPKVCSEFAAKMGLSSGDEMANRPVLARALRVENGSLVGHTVKDANSLMGAALEGPFITRQRVGGKIIEGNADTPIQKGAVLAIAGSAHALLQAKNIVGPEVDDSELLAYPAEELDVVVTAKPVEGKTIKDLEREELARYGRAVFVLGVARKGHPIAVGPELKINRHDVLTVRGVRAHVEDLAKLVGYADRATSKSDMAFMGAGIVIGGLVGAVTVHIAGIPLSLSPSVGALLAGLIFGYLRSIYRTFGRIPEPALWVFNNVGLNGFIAAVGLNSAAGIIPGLAQYGVGLFAAGVVVSLLPLVVAVCLGKYVFKFHPAILLGACAGARSSTASLGALQEAAQSTVPAIGYTIPYAVSRIVLAVCGILILLLMK